MADDSPDRGAPPPSSEARTSAFPAFGAPAAPVAFATEPMPPPDDLIGQGKTGWRRWLPIVLVILFLLLGAIGILVVLGSRMGISALAVGLIAAVIPVPLLIASFLWLDRYEPEPIRYLAFSFAWGAAIATLVAIAVNEFASWTFDKIGLSDAFVAVLVAPFIEESMKGLGPILLFWRRRHEWSGITDGIVYCGFSAVGFAMVENVLYLGKYGYATGVQEYGPANGLQNVFGIFIVRILFTGFAHPLFTSMTGIGLGIASRAGDRRVRWLAPIAGLLLAMMLHGTFNLLPTLTAKLGQPLIMLYGYIGFMVPLFFAVVGFAIAVRSWEGRLTERVLPFYVQSGWFAPPEVAALGSLGRRHSARQWAKRVAGAAGQRAMKSFQFAATQLALLRDGLQRGLDHRPEALRRAAAEEKRLLAAIGEYREVFAGRDPQTPQAFWDGRNYLIAFPDGATRTVAPPAEPVVPVPVRLAPNPYPQYAMAPGYPPASGPPGYPASPYPVPGYPASPYSAPGYGTTASVPSAYGPPGYAPSGYGTPAYQAPSYGAPGYSPPGYQPRGYPAQPYSYPALPPVPIPSTDTPGPAAPSTPIVEPPPHPGGQR